MKLMICVLGLGLSWVTAGEWSVSMEAGGIAAGRADVRIPNEGGTRFSFTDDLSASRGGVVRGQLAWRPGDAHLWMATAAPVRVRASGSFDAPVTFRDTEFPAGEPVRGRYVFDNLRLTYRYRVRETERSRLELGASLFVRLAEVRLESGDLREVDDDLGAVPLLAFAYTYALHPRWQLRLEGDALIGPQGRAADVVTALDWSASDRLTLSAGYRIIEGGADTSDVFTFALFHQAVLGLRYQW